MKRVLKVGCLGLVALFVVAVAVFASTATGQQLWVNRDVLFDGTAEADKVKTADGVVDLMVEKPRLVSVAAWSLDDPDAGVYVDADRVRPLASAAKSLVASTLASAFERGERSPETALPISEVERFYLPGTDGNAHPAAMKELGNPQSVTLEQLAFAMIRYSDNAATDTLMMNLGRAALEAEVQRLGIEGLFPTAPYSGNLAALVEDGTGGRAVDVDRTWALAAKLAGDAAWSKALREKPLPPIREQRAHRLASPNRGTARAYATLMAKVATDQTGWGASMRRWLSWPMKSEQIRARYAQFGSKGGATASVITGASYAQPHGGGISVSALFFEDLPTLPWVTLMQNFKQQEVEEKLLTDAAFRRQLAERFAVAGSGR